MARQSRKVSSTGVYHVLLRGINRQRIFEDNNDYLRFLEYLDEVKKISELVLYAYCLMDNHVHLLIKEGTEPLAMVFRRLGTRYVRWFNEKYDRCGHLFQDRFRIEPVETNEYFSTVLLYIFQNPVKAGCCLKAEDYLWSSRRFLESKNALLDSAELMELVSVEDIRQREADLLEEKSLEPMARRHNIYSDDDLVQMMQGFCSAKNASEVQRMSKDEQRKLVLRMREKKVPIRQLARIAGISKGVLERWIKKG